MSPHCSVLEQGLKAVLLAKGSKHTTVNLFLMFVDRRGGQSEEGAIPTLSFFLLVFFSERSVTTGSAWDEMSYLRVIFIA